MDATSQLNGTSSAEPADASAHIAVHRSGSGAPVVLLHAVGTASRAWEPVLPALSQQFDVLAVDLPGFRLGTSAGFDATLAATIHRHYAPQAPVDVPVTVAFGSRDRILLRRRWRSTERLPGHTVVVQLPGCGHIPMADDPAAVTRLIAATAARTRSTRARP